MRLDDQPMGTIQLGADSIAAPNEGGLYFGGVPPELIVDEMAASDSYLTGTIKEAIFNNKYGHISCASSINGSTRRNDILVVFHFAD